MLFGKASEVAIFNFEIPHIEIWSGLFPPRFQESSWDPVIPSGIEESHIVSEGWNLMAQCLCLLSGYYFDGIILFILQVDLFMVFEHVTFLFYADFHC